MKVTRYVNAFVQNTPIRLGDDQDQAGTLLSEYDVTEYWDLRSSTSSSTPRRAYIVNLRQRLTLANKNAEAIAEGPHDEKQGYLAYPVLAVNGVRPTPWRKDLQFYLEDYAPKTLNASVTTSNNQSTDSQNSGSVQHTAGSSTSVTNSYETSVSAGFSGESLTGSVTSGFSHATTNTTEQSTSRETGHSQGQQAGSSSSMSVKDWSSYAFIDAAKQQASWAWGQEYPWNVIDFRDSDGGKSVNLPLYVQKLLFDGTFLYPPSQISQFGLNFVCHATWVFFSDTTAGPNDEQVDFEHTLSYWEASHSVDGGKLNAVMAQVIPPNHTVETVTLNLPVLALEPITSSGPDNGAVAGFVRSEFITLPGNDRPFRLKSHANNVYVSNGTGFGAPADDDAILSARGVTAGSPAHLTVQFKIVDPDIELALHLKHWKLSAQGCRLTVTVNGQSIMRHVDANNAAAGGDNITTIALRSRDYTSADYYDYLVMGINTIDITIAPADGAGTCDYALRALAVQ